MTSMTYDDTALNDKRAMPSHSLESLLSSSSPALQLHGLALKTADGETYSSGHAMDERQLPMIERYVADYRRTEGKKLEQYLQQGHGRKITVNAIGSTKLPDQVIAAIASNKYSNTLLANRDFEGKVSKLATNYGLSFEEGMRYVLSHEMIHAAGVHSEVETEQTLAHYFTQQARDYQHLAKKSSGDAQKANEQKAASYQRLAQTAKKRTSMGEYKLQGKHVVENTYSKN